MDTELKHLVGKKVLKVFINSEYLKFETDFGDLVYRVDGDCCSSSYFYDFYGLDNLLENGKVKEVKYIQLEPTDLKVKSSNYGEEIQVYGFQITTENEDYGDVTSVFSFRNSSNGYYGGSINEVLDYSGDIPELKEDVSEIKFT